MIFRITKIIIPVLFFIFLGGILSDKAYADSDDITISPDANLIAGVADIALPEGQTTWDCSGKFYPTYTWGVLCTGLCGTAVTHHYCISPGVNGCADENKIKTN